jgi:hypothetical protein
MIHVKTNFTRGFVSTSLMTNKPSVPRVSFDVSSRRILVESAT